MTPIKEEAVTSYKRITVPAIIIFLGAIIAVLGCNSSVQDIKKAQGWKQEGDFQFNQQKFDEAISDYNKALELDPNYSLAYTNRGSAYLKKYQFDKAMADYNRALELDPSNAAAYFNRGLVYEIRGEHDKAESDLNMVIQIATDPELVEKAHRILNDIIGK
jgi:tetratricopeptide (TPR) repeat protein